MPQATNTKAVLQRYRAEPNVDSDACPLEWWKLHAGAHPLLAGLAKRYLSSPATTVPCERLFSLSGHIYLARKEHRLIQAM